MSFEKLFIRSLISKTTDNEISWYAEYTPATDSHDDIHDDIHDDGYMTYYSYDETLSLYFEITETKVTDHVVKNEPSLVRDLYDIIKSKPIKIKLKPSMEDVTDKYQTLHKTKFPVELNLKINLVTAKYLKN